MERQFIRYCERGLDASFWAEPANAVSNAGFIIAGMLCLLEILRQPPNQRGWMATALSALIIVIGIGSFLFHTYATRWAGAADVIPIVLFMLLAVYASFRRLLGAPVWASLLAVPGFIGLLFLAFQFRCSIEGVSFGGQVGTPCFGGSIGYAPALLMLLSIGGVLTAMGRAAGPRLMAAGAVFAVSLTARTLDKQMCDLLLVGGYPLGAHFIWHLLNSVTLYLTATAMSRYGGKTHTNPVKTTDSAP
ncbi:MAG: ceramidase [Rhodobacteraceae bacterium]|nr:ceramidase [Paracoccaceae bacterium]